MFSLIHPALGIGSNESPKAPGVCAEKIQAVLKFFRIGFSSQHGGEGFPDKSRFFRKLEE